MLTSIYRVRNSARAACGRHDARPRSPTTARLKTRFSSAIVSALSYLSAWEPARSHFFSLFKEFLPHKEYNRSPSTCVHVHGERLLLLAFCLLLLADVYFVYSSTPCTLHLLLYFNVLYIVAYSTYFRCILLYSMYSVCTPPRANIIRCTLLCFWSTCIPPVLRVHSSGTLPTALKCPKLDINH